MKTKTFCAKCERENLKNGYCPACGWDEVSQIFLTETLGQERISEQEVDDEREQQQSARN